MKKLYPAIATFALLVSCLAAVMPALAQTATTQNFDASTTLPTTTSSSGLGFVFNGPWVVNTTQPKSAPNSLTLNVQGANDSFGSTALDPFGGNLAFSADMYQSVVAGGVAQTAFYLRGSVQDPLATQSSQVVATFSYGAAGAGGTGISLAAPGYSSGNHYLTSIGQGVYYHVVVSALGTAVSLTVTRYTDGYYLQPDGTWNAAPASVYSGTSTSTATAGYVGVTNANFGGVLYTDNISETAAATPLAASAAAVGAATAGSLAVSWTAATGGTPPCTYQLLRAPDVSGAPGTFAPTGPSTSGLSYTDTALSAGTKYWYKVQATDFATPTAALATSSAVFGTTVAAAVSALVPSGITYKRVFVAPYGAAYSGLGLGYTVYDSTGAVIAARTTAGVSEVPGSGIYAVQAALDAAYNGALVFDSPPGLTPVAVAFESPREALSAAEQTQVAKIGTNAADSSNAVTAHAQTTANGTAIGSLNTLLVTTGVKLLPSEYASIAAATLSQVVDGTITLKQAQLLQIAYDFGLFTRTKTSTTQTVTFSNRAGQTVATNVQALDANGNPTGRTSITFSNLP